MNAHPNSLVELNWSDKKWRRGYKKWLKEIKKDSGAMEQWYQDQAAS
jgi:hypothetical protein